MFPNRMNFRKSSKRPLTPTLIFGKLYCAFRDKIVTKVRMFIMVGLLCIIWSYFPWDACSTTVQHSNWLKTYPKKTLCSIFMLKKPCLKVQILQYKFLDWKWPPLLPSEFFQKFIRFGDVCHPLPVWLCIHSGTFWNAHSREKPNKYSQCDFVQFLQTNRRQSWKYTHTRWSKVKSTAISTCVIMHPGMYQVGDLRTHLKVDCKLATLSRWQKPMLPGRWYLSMSPAGQQSLQFYNEFIKWWPSANIFQCWLWLTTW